jgi:ParB family transcriptional regulator, chromosome partitioning protein
VIIHDNINSNIHYCFLIIIEMKATYSTHIQGVIEEIPLSLLKPFRFYHRKNPDDRELQNLQFSLQKNGVLYPLIVRNVGSFYEIVRGHRRYKACKTLGWKKILCHIIDATDKEAYEIALMTNIQRKLLTPIEEAQAFDEYLSNYKWGDITELAQSIGKSRSYIYRRLKLLEFPSDIVTAISNSDIDPSIIEELASIKDPSLKEKLAEDALENKYTCMQIRQIKKIFEEDKSINDNLYFEHKDKSINDNLYFEHKDKDKDKDDCTNLVHIDEKTIQRLFNKMIILLKNTSRNMMPIIEDSEENWIVYTTFMQHKKTIDSHVDTLIKEKKKIKKEKCNI